MTKNRNIFNLTSKYSTYDRSHRLMLDPFSLVFATSTGTSSSTSSGTSGLASSAKLGLGAPDAALSLLAGSLPLIEDLLATLSGSEGLLAKVEEANGVAGSDHSSGSGGVEATVDHSGLLLGGELGEILDDIGSLRLGLAPAGLEGSKSLLGPLSLSLSLDERVRVVGLDSDGDRSDASRDGCSAGTIC